MSTIAEALSERRMNDASRRSQVLRRLVWAQGKGTDAGALRVSLGWPSGVGVEPVLRELAERGEAYEDEGVWRLGPKLGPSGAVKPDGARAPSDTTAGPAPVVQAGAAPAIEADGAVLISGEVGATVVTRVESAPPSAHGVDRYEAGPADSTSRCEGSPPPLIPPGGAPPTKPETLTTTVEPVASVAGVQRQADRLEAQDTRTSGKRGLESRSAESPTHPRPTMPEDSAHAYVLDHPGCSLSALAVALGQDITALGRTLRADPRFAVLKAGPHRSAPVTIYAVSPPSSPLSPPPGESAPASGGGLAWAAPGWLAEALDLDDGDPAGREEVEAALRGYAPRRDPDDIVHRVAAALGMGAPASVTAERVVEEAAVLTAALETSRHQSAETLESVRYELRKVYPALPHGPAEAVRALVTERAELTGLTHNETRGALERDRLRHRIELRATLGLTGDEGWSDLLAHVRRVFDDRDAVEREAAALRPTNPPPIAGISGCVVGTDPMTSLHTSPCPPWGVAPVVIAERLPVLGDAELAPRDTHLDLREELLDAAAYAWKAGLVSAAYRLLDVAVDPARWSGLQNGLEVQAGHLRTVESELRRLLGHRADFVFLESELVDALHHLEGRVPAEVLSALDGLMDEPAPPAERVASRIRGLIAELDRLRESYAQEVARVQPASAPDDLRPLVELLVRRVAGDTLAGSPLPVRLAFAVGALGGA